MVTNNHKLYDPVEYQYTGLHIMVDLGVPQLAIKPLRRNQTCVV